jgi:hypothetical protein
MPPVARLGDALYGYLSQPAPVRPLWARAVFPAVGCTLCTVGLLGVITPGVPGFPLILIGAPWMVGFRRSWEQRAREAMVGALLACRRRIERWRARRSETTPPL